MPKVLGKQPNPQMLAVQPWAINANDQSWVWDFSVDLEAIRSIEIAPRSLANELDLPLTSSVRVLVEWKSSHGPLLSGKTDFFEIQLDSDFHEFQLDLRIAGANTGGKLTLSTLLCIGKDTLIPTGTLIWSDEFSLDLESHAPRIPVSVVHFSEFSNRFADSDARWSVELMTDGYHCPVSTGVQIFLNADHKKFVNQITGGEDEFAERFFRYEVGRSLLYRVIMDEIFEFGAGYEPGTVGDSLKAKIRAIFPGVDLATLRSQLTTLPHEFDATLQAHFLRED